MPSHYHAEQSAKFAFALGKVKQSKRKWDAVKGLPTYDLMPLLPYYKLEASLFRFLAHWGCGDWAVYNECVEREHEGHTEDAVREIKDENSSHKKYGFPDEVLTRTEFLAQASKFGRNPDALNIGHTEYALMRKEDEEWKTFVPPSTE